MVQQDEAVRKGQVIGYIVNLTGNVDATGNARNVKDPTARWQTHFEFISAPSGRRGGSIRGGIQGSDGRVVDPTTVLIELGYRMD